MTANVGQDARRHTPVEDSHDSEWQESHEYQRCCDLPKLTVCILRSQFYFSVSILLFVTF
jgi:hypothetical protein